MNRDAISFVLLLLSLFTAAVEDNVELVRKLDALSVTEGSTTKQTCPLSEQVDASEKATKADKPATPATIRQVQTHKDVAYYEGIDKDKEGYHTLDVYSPKGVKDAPVLLFVHGGGWSRREGDGYAKGRGGPHCQGFAFRGIVVMSMSYRLSPEHKHPAHVEDVARAIAWANANATKYGGDPKKLFLTGHSAGGHLVTLVVADPKYLAAHKLKADDIRGVIPISAPFTVDAKGGKSKVWGDDDAAKDASPISHVREGLPPFLVMAGDTTALEKWLAVQNEQFVKKLKENKVSAESAVIQDRKHTTIVTKLGTADDSAAEHILKFIGLFRP